MIPEYFLHKVQGESQHHSRLLYSSNLLAISVHFVQSNPSVCVLPVSQCQKRYPWPLHALARYRVVQLI